MESMEWNVVGVEWSWSGNRVRNLELLRDYFKIRQIRVMFTRRIGFIKGFFKSNLTLGH